MTLWPFRDEKAQSSIAMGAILLGLLLLAIGTGTDKIQVIGLTFISNDLIVVGFVVAFVGIVYYLNAVS